MARILNFLFLVAVTFGKDIPCDWKSLTGAHYDIRPLTVSGSEASYFIIDGDIPCTPEIEPSFQYVWNFCSAVTDVSVPKVCKDAGVDNAYALQYFVVDNFESCYVIGKYEAAYDDLSFKLLDETNPSKGISLVYPSGDRCDKYGKSRSATIDVVCDDVKSVVVSAEEPNPCEYHLVVKSYHGCPTQCPITKAGLCNSHGHCAFDPVAKQSYCYCNAGYSGSSCTKSSSSSEYDGYAVQMGLLVTLLIIALALVSFIGFMIYRITEMRKTDEATYRTLPGTEMTSHHDF